ncbi:hypothetical protein D0869_01431 [Hortaea werneckii]|uniref:Nitrate reductase [NADPH] n=1 Tax=Hortaea werneckii TaxID=91943 RepID=A0A3M6XDC7_HORWE|nr:hypothetical protein D0869_01431 [Hortaea werneckii]
MPEASQVRCGANAPECRPHTTPTLAQRSSEMPYHVPWQVTVHDHPGSSGTDIESESEYAKTRQHRVGFKNRQGITSGITHPGDERRDEPQMTARGDAKEKRLVNFRDLAKQGTGVEEGSTEIPLGIRGVLDSTENWIKYDQAWPINEKQNAIKGKTGASEEEPHDESRDHSQEEEDWKRKGGFKDAHNEAYSTDSTDREQQSSPEQRYTPQEIALLRALQNESTYRQSLKESDGTRCSPQKNNRAVLSIDEKDQLSPDNWLPRSPHLIRLTGNHPLNAEAELGTLYDAGLITPNELHYVRNHGAVPRLGWNSHRLDVENGKMVLSMDELTQRWPSINIAVSLACDGNRRKEVNMIRKSKGFNWGAGATGCAYWKGVLLRNLLLATNVDENDLTTDGGRPRWVNFQGADEPSEAKYATCIPLAYAMDPTNDVLLAYEMNNLPLPPDHGYPLRLIIPGYVGGRCIKWLARIWISDEENSSYYHIWDNRVLPPFITDKDGNFAKTLFTHPSTACNEQNLNSVVVKPAQGEKLLLSRVTKNSTYRIEGYAYDGGGHEVQRVEVSLDDGETWLYCIRKLPEYLVRHGNKFWTWLHWHVDVSMAHLLQAKSIAVRAWNVFKNTQPRMLSWNIMGMMNNCWYTVKMEIIQDDGDPGPLVLFRHPCEPSGNGGWMKPSAENRIQAAKQQARTPQKQFTRQEIEKHDNENDCWLVIDNNVYDATSILSWHPGGKAALLGHAGRVHSQTTAEFSSVHDEYAYKKLQECALGVVTNKTAKFIKDEAEAQAKENAKRRGGYQDVVLQKHRWVSVTLQAREELSKDTRRYTFDLPDDAKNLGLGTCQHIQLGLHMRDKMLIRSYTPTRPLVAPRRPTNRVTEAASDKEDNEEKALEDGQGTFELVVKTYFPNDQTPGGAMSNLLDCMQVGERCEIRGPTGEIVYKGHGIFEIEGEERTVRYISLVLGGSGVTPGYALIARIVASRDRSTQLKVLDANKSEADILLHDELKRLEATSQGQLQVKYVLSHPSESWNGLKGHVNEQMIKDNLFAPSNEAVALLCGPPAMIQKSALPALKGL